MSTPIPPHLAAFDWYAEHQAYQQEQYGYSRHAPPEGVRAVRLDAYLGAVRSVAAIVMVTP